MRILFLSHYFPPEVNAPANRTYEHCVRWARAGHDVTVLTCVPNCPDGVVFDGHRNRWRPQEEWVDGIRVLRVWTYIAANSGTVRRIANYLSFLVMAVITSLRLERPDVVVATSPQFFCGWAGVFVSWLKRRPFVLEIRDIWPESIRTVGAMSNHRLLRMLERLERRLYLAADHIVTVGDGYRDRILEKADGPDRITVITNGVDLSRFQPQSPDIRFLHMWDLEDRFVCSYVGTIGMAHGLEVVLDAAEILKQRGRDDIRFCLVGDGARRTILEKAARERGLDGMILFTGRQPREDISPILASSNACLIHLRSCELFGSVIPSKIFETMAMQRPIIMGVHGPARDIVLNGEAGLIMEPDSAESLAESVTTLADDPKLCARAGKNARAYVSKNFNRDDLAKRYLLLLGHVAGVPVEEPMDEVASQQTADRAQTSETVRVAGTNALSRALYRDIPVSHGRNQAGST